MTDRLRFLIRATLLIALAAVLRPPSAAGLDAWSGLPPQAAPLAPFYRALYELETGVRRDPVVIIQIGDSHTAGGFFTGRLRRLFQDRFGAAGRGMLPPGRPFRYYHPTQVTVSQSNGWKVYNSRKSSGGIFGLTGFRLESGAPNASVTLTAEPQAEFDWFEVEFVGRPGGGTIKVAVDGRSVMSLSTKNDKVEARRVAVMSPSGPHQTLKLSVAGDGPVALLSWTIRRTVPGVVYNSHGIVGATIEVTANWDRETVAWELEHLRPDLIVVEYGGNEGYNDRLDMDEYPDLYRRRLAILKEAAPQAAILVIGPSDGVRLPGYCAQRGASKKRFECRPLTQSEQENYLSLLNNRSRQLCRWHPPPNLGRVRRVQQRIANESGYAFWDWLPIMGGECGVHNWVRQNPPLAAGDYVHLTPPGYEDSADTLFMDIMYYYERYRAAQ